MTTQFEESSRSKSALDQAAEFIRRDLHRRVMRGERARLEDYPEQLTVVRTDPVEFVALILDEYSIRQETGEPLATREFVDRFPESAQSLIAELGGFSQLDDEEISEADSDVKTGQPEAGAGPQRLSDFSEGSVWGDFQIEGTLGSGGVSHVFLATQLSLDRRVALKVTPLEDTDSGGSFEGRTMAALVHDNIVPVFAEQSLGSFHLLAMACVAGPTLAEFLAGLNEGAADRADATGARRTIFTGCRGLIQELADSKLPAKRKAEGNEEAGACSRVPASSERLVEFSCRTVRDIALALAHAHQRNVFHCDIKPQNILFSADARPMLTDFNVSVRSTRELGQQQITRPAGGTLLYMSPEHLGLLTGTNSDSAIDARADVYSLGLILFELLTGAWPFPEEATGSDPLTAAGHLQGIRLSSTIEFPRDSRVSPALRSIVSKCLAVRTDARYQSADELAEDLDRYISLRPLRHAADPSWKERLTRRVRLYRKPIAVSVATSVFSLLVAGALNSEGKSEDRFADSRQIQAASDAFENASMGRRNVELGRFDLAIPSLERAVEQNPQLVPAWNNLGIARYRLGKFSAACEAFGEVIRLGTKTGTSYSHRAAARFAMGDDEGAAADFAAALEVAVPAELDQVLLNISEFKARRAE